MNDLGRMNNEQLMREYLDMNRASFDRMFGMNAKRRLNACVDELLSRGITEIPSIFGTPIVVRKWEL